jgi:hypothetical protein
MFAEFLEKGSSSAASAPMANNEAKLPKAIASTIRLPGPQMGDILFLVQFVEEKVRYTSSRARERDWKKFPQ